MQLSLTTLVSASTTVNQIITEDLTGIMAGIGKQINMMLSRVEVNASHCPQLTRDLQITLKLPSIDGIHSQLFCSGKFSPFNDKYYVSDSNMQIHDRKKWVYRSLYFYLFEIRNELVCNGLAMHFISVVKNHRDHSSMVMISNTPSM